MLDFGLARDPEQAIGPISLIWNRQPLPR